MIHFHAIGYTMLAVYNMFIQLMCSRSVLDRVRVRRADCARGAAVAAGMRRQ
jgi:hypothetical protein